MFVLYALNKTFSIVLFKNRKFNFCSLEIYPFQSQFKSFIPKYLKFCSIIINDTFQIFSEKTRNIKERVEICHDMYWCLCKMTRLIYARSRGQIEWDVLGSRLYSFFIRSFRIPDNTLSAPVVIAR